MNRTPDPNQTTGPTMDHTGAIEAIMGEIGNRQNVERPRFQADRDDEGDKGIGDETESRGESPQGPWDVRVRCREEGVGKRSPAVRIETESGCTRL